MMNFSYQSKNGICVSALCMAMMCSISATGQTNDARPECYVDLPVFGGEGDPLSYKIVRIESDEPGVNRIAKQCQRFLEMSPCYVQ